jgi:squalene-hopene/tetraprenyl-beta-curcumene cyclase
MHRLCGTLLVLCVGHAWAFAGESNAVSLPKPAPNKPNEPLRKEWSPEKAAEFLDSASLNWTRDRQCGACHTNYPYLMARPAMKTGDANALKEVRTFFEDRAANWEKGEKHKPRWDTEVVATAVSLALNDAATTGKLHPLSRKALDQIWKLQKPTGEWNWLKCNWPPLEHDDYFGAVFVAVGVGTAPDDYRNTPTAKEGLSRVTSFLKTNPAPDLHHRIWLLWASQRVDGLLDKKIQESIITEILQKQRDDGGWTLASLGNWMRHDKSANDANGPSDGYATGLVVYVLRQAGVKSSDAPIRRGVEWLKSHQTESGRWFTRSLNRDGSHYMTHAGSAFAVMAIRACE